MINSLKYLRVTEMDGYWMTIIQFRHKRITDDLVGELGAELVSVTDSLSTKYVVIDFGGVEAFPESLTNRLAVLRRCAERLGGGLLICGIHGDKEGSLLRLEREGNFDFVDTLAGASRFFRLFAARATHAFS